MPYVLPGEIERVGMRNIGHDFDSLVADVGKNGRWFPERVQWRNAFELKANFISQSGSKIHF